MYEYDEECLQTFLNMQSQLFDEPVAETLEEAEAFLEDCMAAVVDSIKDVRDYLDESIEWAVKFLHENLPEVVCYKPEGTYILWMDFSKTGYTPEEVHEKIYNQANILIADGSKYDSVEGKNYQRMCLPISRKRVKEAFYRIKNVFG